MNFEPTDYLQNLNLDFESFDNNNDSVSPHINQQQLQHDLDLFSQAANDFFDLDVLNNDIKPVKPVTIKQESNDFKHYNSNQFYPSPDFQFLQPSHQLNTQQSSRGVKRSSSVASTPASTTSSSTFGDAHFAAHEDKRKRNTAASARFRVKKKLKEQEMEKKSKELEDKVATLERKLKTMEMENKCLKSIILQQNEKKDVELLESIKKKSILSSETQFEFTN